MSKLTWISLLAALSFSSPTQAGERKPYDEGYAPHVAPRAAAGPVIYRFSGVRDDGSAANVGIATTIHCSNFGNASATVQVIIYQWTGGVVANARSTLDKNVTRTFSTHQTNVYYDDVVLSAGQGINQGSGQVRSSSSQVVCTAQVLDAANAPAQSMAALHMMRFNPAPNSQE